MENYEWYSALMKPTWAPPSWIFGPVWTVLYLIIAVTFGAIAWKVIRRKMPAITALPFALNLFFNLIFTPLQFGLQNLALATIDIYLVLGTLIWALYSVRRTTPWVSYANIPYLLWVTFATALQTTICFIN